MKVVSQWYNKERNKTYQLREYGQEMEVYVLMGVGWFKSVDITPDQLVEGDVWEKLG
tara:strand:- start:5861 stop:6031 length:171 start_codon:yes stop_codon:yes gene_type:complete